MTTRGSVLVDTSIWADHFRSGDAALGKLLAAGAVRMHPFVVGELAMGNLRDRARTVALLQALPSLTVTDDAAWHAFVDREALAGSGLGFVDAHLLAASAAAGVRLWTRDRRLAARATAMGCAWNE